MFKSNDTAWAIPLCTHACVVRRVHACADKEVEQMQSSVDIVEIFVINAYLSLPSGQGNLGYSFRENSSTILYIMRQCNFYNYLFLFSRHTHTLNAFVTYL